MNVHLWPEENMEDTVFRSKAVGEPPFMLAISVWEALREAIAAARADRGVPGAARVQMDAPATAERVLWAVNGRLKRRVQPRAQRQKACVIGERRGSADDPIA